MRPAVPKFVLAGVMVLAITAAGIVIIDTIPRSNPSRNVEEFQQLVGGLGLGPATDLSTCSFAFDPRIGITCDRQYDPIPMGSWFCTAHMCSCFSLAPLSGQGEFITETVPNAPAH